MGKNESTINFLLPVLLMKKDGEFFCKKQKFNLFIYLLHNEKHNDKRELRSPGEKLNTCKFK